jgi:hypothetical protein
MPSTTGIPFIDRLAYLGNGGNGGRGGIGG